MIMDNPDTPIDSHIIELRRRQYKARSQGLLRPMDDPLARGAAGGGAGQGAGSSRGKRVAQGRSHRGRWRSDTEEEEDGEDNEDAATEDEKGDSDDDLACELLRTSGGCMQTQQQLRSAPGPGQLPLAGAAAGGPVGPVGNGGKEQRATRRGQGSEGEGAGAAGAAGSAAAGVVGEAGAANEVADLRRSGRDSQLSEKVIAAAEAKAAEAEAA